MADTGNTKTTRDGRPLYGPGSAFHGKKGASGPAKGNQNATRHGMRGSKLPSECKFIELRVNNLRRQMEEAVLAVKGEINIVDAAAINSILQWERHGALAAYWLRKEAKTLSAGDRLRFSEACAKASDNRDRNIRQLGLDHDKAEDLLDRLYARDVQQLPAPDDAAGNLEDK
jgi:hypothetical protein